MRAVALGVARGRGVEAARSLDSLEPWELEEVIRTSRAEGLLPLLAEAGRKTTRHPGLGRRCGEWTREAIRHDLVTDRVLSRTTDFLNRARIPFLLWKGACFRELLYPATWLRVMADVDFLVHPEDLERAVHVLADQGFRPRTSYPARPFSMRFSLERQVDAPDGGLIEMHGGPTYEPHGLRADLEGMFSRAIQAPSGLVPSWEDHLLLVAVHQARTGMLAAVRPFLDMALLIETKPLDWTAVTQRAQSWGCASALHFSLQAVRCLFGSTVSGSVLDRTAPRGLRGALLRGLASRGSGDPIGGRLRVAPIPRDAPETLYHLFRPMLYALFLDRFSPRLSFLAWIAFSRLVDVSGLTRSPGSAITLS